MAEREKNFGVFKGVVPLNDKFVGDDVFYLTEVDDKWRRKYEIKNPTVVDMNKRPISAMLRL